MFEVLFTSVVFLAYLAVRRPFARMPLHIDTGFYVSNHTISTGRFRFAEGWNAHYAGCAKLIPELFYSAIYLCHRARVRTAGESRVSVRVTGAINPSRAVDRGDHSYVRTSRHAMSVFNFATAIVVAGVAAKLLGGGFATYAAVLVAFALISSEVQYGVYFECAEKFEMMPQALAVGLAVVGVNFHQPACIALAACLLAAETCFIKLSSLVFFVAFLTPVSYSHPWTIPWVLMGGLPAGAAFLVWIRLNGRSPRALVGALVGHEASFNKRSGWRGFIHRFRERIACIGNVWMRQPVIPILALVGALVVGRGGWWIAWYAIAAAATFVVQAADCRYYLILALPPIAILAGVGAGALISVGPPGMVALIGLAAVWFFTNVMRVRSMDELRLGEWCWSGFRSRYDALRNLALHRASPTLRDTLHGGSVLVYGPMNQAYVLLDSAYPTSMVAPEHYLDDMIPNWQATLNQQLLSNPPAYVLDTANCFAVQRVRDELGLGYRLTHVVPGGLRLFRLLSRTPITQLRPDVRTFASQTTEQSRSELARTGGSVLLVDVGDDLHAELERTEGQAEQLQKLLIKLADRGYRQIAVYGAGRFTARHAEVYRRSPAPITLILDDGADRFDGRFLDWPIKTPIEAQPGEFDAVVVSTDRFTGPMVARASEWWQNQVPVFSAV